MKQIAKLGMGVTILLVLSGCMSMRTDTKATALPDNAVPKLNVKQPVALRNVAAKAGDLVIGKWVGWTVYGDMYKFTESAIGTAKTSLEQQNIQVKNSADKVLELSVHDAKSEQGAWTFAATTALSVKTGDGLNKEYVGVQKHGNGYGTTAAIEQALAKCVTQMLNDKDVIRYLEN